MLRYLTALSRRSEFVVVIAAAFGIFIYSSVWAAFHPTTMGRESDASLVAISVYELIALIALGTFLRLRGWSLKSVGLAISPVDTLIGLGLAALSYGAYVLAWIVLASASPDTAERLSHFKFMNVGLSLPLVVFTSVLNPVFEELFVSGYVIMALKNAGREQLGINLSVAIRLSYHLYQGTLSVLSVLPFGLIMAYWYARNGRLWPLIVAHAAIDFVGLMQFVRH